MGRRNRDVLKEFSVGDRIYWSDVRGEDGYGTITDIYQHATSKGKRETGCNYFVQLDRNPKRAGESQGRCFGRWQIRHLTTLEAMADVLNTMAKIQ